jgi:hypothetical protein
VMSTSFFIYRRGVAQRSLNALNSYQSTKQQRVFGACEADLAGQTRTTALERNVTHFITESRIKHHRCLADCIIVQSYIVKLIVSHLIKKFPAILWNPKLGYGLEDRGSRIRFPVGTENFTFHHRVQNGSGAHPASYPTGTRSSFPGVKWPGCEADHSPPSSAEVKECVELNFYSPSKNSWLRA